MKTLQIEKTTARRFSFRAVMLVFLLLVALCTIVTGVYLSIPGIQAGFQNWSVYLDLSWVHQAGSISVLVNFILMLWLSLSALFFGGWLMRWSIRKLRGKSWSLGSGANKRKAFFPPVLLYLKLSCFFLLLIFLFVASQYPLQFMFNL